MTYAVYVTETFNTEIKNISGIEKEKIIKIFLQLKKNPYVGDQIKYRFFREKRIKEKRIYYLIYDDLLSVLVVAFGGKKAQQQTINKIINYLPEFKKYLRNILKKE